MFEAFGQRGLRSLGDLIDSCRDLPLRCWFRQKLESRRAIKLWLIHDDMGGDSGLGRSSNGERVELGTRPHFANALNENAFRQRSGRERHDNAVQQDVDFLLLTFLAEGPLDSQEPVDGYSRMRCRHRRSVSKPEFASYVRLLRLACEYYGYNSSAGGIPKLSVSEMA